MIVVCNIDQFRADLKIIAALGNGAGENGFHPKLFACLLRIDILSLVVENGTSGLDRKIGKLRQGINERFSDAIAEILRAGIRADVLEWQHRKRIDRLMAARQKEICCNRAGDNYDCCSADDD